MRRAASRRRLRHRRHGSQLQPLLATRRPAAQDQAGAASTAMAAPRSTLVVLAAVLLCAVVAAPSGSTLSKAQLRALFVQNLRRFQAFPCKQPQRRSVMVGELLLSRGQLSPSETIVPPATVLHLCGPTTGCCFSADTVCSAKETQTVSLPFRVQNALKGSSEFTEMSINFVNHTRCGCVPRSEASDTEVVVWETNSIA